MKPVCFSVLFAIVCLAQVPKDMRPGKPPVVPASANIDKDLPYSTHKETVLDILHPKDPSPGKRPGVLLIHGGGWTGGVKEDRMEYAAAKYLEKGFVVANVEYRLAKVAKAPAAVEDVLRAANWFRDNAKKYNVDPNRIVATGDSAGGHLALMVGMTPKSAKLGPPAKVAAVVNFYGITDVEDQLAGPNRRDYAVSWMTEDPGLGQRVSPITYVRKGLPPILTIHGDADETVPYEHATRLTKALLDAGAEATLHTVAGEGHSIPKAKLDAEYEQIFAFLKQHKILQ
jgi:acetyl esterase/lipase